MESVPILQHFYWKGDLIIHVYVCEYVNVIFFSFVKLFFKYLGI